MPDLNALIEHAAPATTPPIDVDRIRQHARQRRQRTHTVTAASIVSVVVLLVALGVHLAPDPTSPTAQVETVGPASPGPAAADLPGPPWQPVSGDGALGTKALWPTDDRTISGSLADAAQLFASSVLGLPSGTPFETDTQPQVNMPLPVRYRLAAGQPADATFVPRPGGSWIVVEVGGPAGYSAQRVTFSPVAGSAGGTSTVRISVGSNTVQRPLRADEVMHGQANVGVAGTASVIVVLRDASGRVLGASGADVQALQPPATTPPPSRASPSPPPSWQPVIGPGQLGTNGMWPDSGHVATGSIDTVARQFATSVLGLPADAEVMADPSAGPSDPNWVHFDGTSGPLGEALFIPRPNSTWIVLQVGGGLGLAGRGPNQALSFSDSPLTDADPAHSFVRVRTASVTQQRSLTADELTARRVPVTADEAAAAIVVALDAHGHLVAMFGTSLVPQDPTPGTSALGQPTG